MYGGATGVVAEVDDRSVRVIEAGTVILYAIEIDFSGENTLNLPNLPQVSDCSHLVRGYKYYSILSPLRSISAFDF